MCAMSLAAVGCQKESEKPTNEEVTEVVVEVTSTVEATTKAPEILNYVTARGEHFSVQVNDSWAKNNFDKAKFVHDGSKLSYTGNDYTYRLGVDVSKFQGNIDWNAVKNDGYDFAIVRIGYRGYGGNGSLNEDPYGVSNIKKAREAGLDVGLYFFSQAINEEEAIEEARYVLSILEKAGLTNKDVNLPITFDPENILDDDARTDNVTGEQFTKNTHAFIKTIKDAGYDGMIYSNMLWEAEKLDLGQFDNYKIWYADYENAPQTPYRFEFWQYSEKATVNGISGICDTNIQLIKK